MIDKSSTMKLLYVTPEKLAKSKRFMAKLEKMYQVGRFSRLVIDEVHCCSQWGHDFRPGNFTCLYSRLPLSQIPRDSLKHFEISILRHIRVERVRKTIN